MQAAPGAVRGTAGGLGPTGPKRRPAHRLAEERKRKRNPNTVTALTLSTSSPASLRADAVVIGVAKGEKGPVVAPGAEAVDQAFGGKLAAVLETLGATGGEGEVTKLPSPD